MSDRAVVLVVVLVVAPFALVLLAAVVRGYAITLVMRRDRDDHGKR